MSVKIKVMTFNLRIPSDVDGESHFEFRKDKIIEIIKAEAPDIIGFQEAADVSFDLLKERLTDYYILGHGRDKRYHGEGIPIAFRKDAFSLCGFRQEWLSLEPRKPASYLKGSDQSKCPRVYSCAELIHRDGEVPFAFYNIHSDHRGETAKVIESAILMRDIMATPYKFVLTGDFNARQPAPSIDVILATADNLGTVDATANIRGSFHGFSKAEAGPGKIDYIFTNLPTNPEESYAVIDEDRPYYSDHHALCAFVEI